MLWVLATLVAAGAQTARNAMQSSLTATLGTLGATQVRFVYGLPFAAAFLALAAALAGRGVPVPTSTFLAYTAAVNVKALGLVEVVFAQLVAHRVFAQRATTREAVGMGLVVAGVTLLLLAL